MLFLTGPLSPLSENLAVVCYFVFSEDPKVGVGAVIWAEGQLVSDHHVTYQNKHSEMISKHEQFI